MQRYVARRNAEKHVKVSVGLDELLKVYFESFFEAVSAVEKKISCVIEVQQEIRKDVIEVKFSLQSAQSSLEVPKGMG